ncbi:MAG: hypothetical protein E6Q97_30335 [Desulfurellales bacterium]|nr:MAG: hypothetical protein E6Q97_30335 [Desulfurellales bacterium]
MNTPFRASIQGLIELQTEPTDYDREVWIVPGNGSANKGIGTQCNPLRVTTPQDFDDVFRKKHAAHRPTAYRLMPGTYFTQGCWAHPKFATLFSGDALIGTTGVNIYLSSPVTVTNGTKRPDLHVIGAGSPFEAGAECRIENVSILGLDYESEADDRFVTSGLRCYGQNCLVRNVEVNGLRGSYDPVQTVSGKIALEAFGISFETGQGCRAIDCRVDAHSEQNDYVSAFSAAPCLFDGVVFDRCAARGAYQHAAFTVYANTVLRNCRSGGFAYGIYNDTGTIFDVSVDGGFFECNRVGLGLVATFPAGAKRSVWVNGARFMFPKWQSPPVGIELIAKPNVPDLEFSDIAVTRCLFESESRFTLVSTDAPARLLKLIRVSDSIVPLDTRLNAPEGHTMRFTGLLAADGTPFLDTKPAGKVATFTR